MSRRIKFNMILDFELLRILVSDILRYIIQNLFDLVYIYLITILILNVSSYKFSNSFCPAYNVKCEMIYLSHDISYIIVINCCALFSIPFQCRNTESKQLMNCSSLWIFFNCIIVTMSDISLHLLKTTRGCDD